MTQRFDVRLEGSPFVDDLSELQRAAERSADFLGRLIGGLREPVQLVRSDGDGRAAFGTTEVRMSAQLSEQLADLLAALRAGEFDHLLVDKAHGAGCSRDEC